LFALVPAALLTVTKGGLTLFFMLPLTTATIYTFLFCKFGLKIWHKAVYASPYNLLNFVSHAAA
jgi:hypothetical protein